MQDCMKAIDYLTPAEIYLKQKVTGDPYSMKVNYESLYFQQSKETQIKINKVKGSDRFFPCGLCGFQYLVFLVGVNTKVEDFSA